MNFLVNYTYVPLLEVFLVTQKVLFISILALVLSQKVLTSARALGNQMNRKPRCMIRKDMGNAQGASQNCSFSCAS